MTILLKRSDYVPPIDIEKDELEEIVSHLDRAYELNNNYSTLYDKGFLCRQVGRPKDALDAFLILIQTNGDACSVAQLANAYF